MSLPSQLADDSGLLKILCISDMGRRFFIWTTSWAPPGPISCSLNGPWISELVEECASLDSSFCSWSFVADAQKVGENSSMSSILRSCIVVKKFERKGRCASSGNSYVGRKTMCVTSKGVELSWKTGAGHMLCDALCQSLVELLSPVTANAFLVTSVARTDSSTVALS